MGKRLKAHEQAEAVLHAAVFGDDGACARYGITTRTLRRYREEVRDPESELSAFVRQYQAAAQEANGQPEAAAETRVESWADYVRGQVRKASDIIVRKAEEINAANPESIRAVNDHVSTLLGHATALQYLDGLFGAQTARPAGASDSTPAGEGGDG